MTEQLDVTFTLLIDPGPLLPISTFVFTPQLGFGEVDTTVKLLFAKLAVSDSIALVGLTKLIDKKPVMNSKKSSGCDWETFDSLRCQFFRTLNMLINSMYKIINEGIKIKRAAFDQV
jgi:hypothetical protein